MHTTTAAGRKRAGARAKRRPWTLAAGAAGFLALASVATGCGYDDPGEGSQTVKLQASLACAYPELVSRAQLTLSHKDAPLANANVTFIDAETKEQLDVPLANANVTFIDAETKEQLDVPATEPPGTYAAAWPGYHRRVQVHVWQGADGMTFQVEGPSQHVIDTPSPGTVLGRTSALAVRWRTPDGVRADEVEATVEGPRTAARRVRDGGKVRFSHRELGEGQQVLTVRRARHMVPAGAAPDSRMTVSYAVTTPLVRTPEDSPHD